LAVVIGGGVLKGPYFFGSDLEGPVLLQSQLVSVFLGICVCSQREDHA